MRQRKKYPDDEKANWGPVAWYGFKNTLSLLYGYTAVFIGYALLRSSLELAGTLSLEQGLLATLLLHLFSVLFSSLALATVLAVVPAGIGMITALWIAWLLGKFRIKTVLQIRLTGLLGALMISIAFHLLLYSFLNFSPFTQPPVTYFFWLGIPAIIQLGAGFVWSKQLAYFPSKQN